MSQHAPSAGNMAEILPEVHGALVEADIADEVQYGVVGGMAVELLLASTEYDPEMRVVDAPSGIEIGTHRANGSHRDLDLLIISRDAALGERAVSVIEEVTDPFSDEEMTVSVFTFKEHEAYMGSHWKGMFKDFTTHRTMDENGQTYYVLHPFVTETDNETYSPWTVMLDGDDKIQVLDPVSIEMSYRIRSVGGIRPRDIPKIEGLSEHLAEHMDGYDERRHDGELFAGWNQMFDNMNLVVRTKVASLMREGNHAEALHLLWFAAKRGAAKRYDGWDLTVNASQGAGPLAFLEKRLNAIAGAKSRSEEPEPTA